MVERCTGDLLRADAEALVNTVNTVGVMGKGVALQFRKAFPENFKAYQRACKHGELEPGRMFVFETGQITGPRVIINFPTKRHWRGKSRIEYIDSGLTDLVDVLRRYEIRSVAVPPLGCGNGGLRWSEVRPRIEAALSNLHDVDVLLYEPTGAPPVEHQQVATKRPAMTRGRAAMLAALSVYQADPTSTVTALVAQKLAYLLQAAGEPLKLEFVKAKYGPYAEVVNHVMQSMEGHYVSGVGDRTTDSSIRLTDGSADLAHEFLKRHPDGEERIERVRRLVEGFESPFGLELLTTVHWAAAQDGASTSDEALGIVADWTPRKREVFQEHHVRIAWERLVDEGWLDTAMPRGPASSR